MGTWNGFKYNLSKDNVVRIIPSSDMGMIESSIFQILNTYPGERVHLPDFGSRLKLLVYEPLDEFLAIQIKSEIKEAINRWENRVIVDDVIVSLPQEKDGSEGTQRINASVRFFFKEGIKNLREFRIVM